MPMTCYMASKTSWREREQFPKTGNLAQMFTTVWALLKIVKVPGDDIEPAAR